MQLAVISPPSLLEFSAGTTYHLVLPHLLRTARYSRFYHEAPGYKILDNGVAEDVNVDDDDLIALMATNNFDELVVPDAMGDCELTIWKMNNFERLAKANPWYSYMGVCHGTTMPEVMKCIQAMYYSPYITTIGLPRILVDTIHREARVNLAQFIYSHLGLDKPIHCLGSGSFKQEPILLNELGAATPRGIDTSMPVYMGMLLKDIETDNYERRPSDYFDRHTGPAERKWIEHNVRVYTHWCGAAPSFGEV